MESEEGRLCVLVEAQRPAAVMEFNLSYPLDVYGEVALCDARVRLWLAQRYANTLQESSCCPVTKNISWQPLVGLSFGVCLSFQAALTNDWARWSWFKGLVIYTTGLAEALSCLPSGITIPFNQNFSLSCSFHRCYSLINCFATLTLFQWFLGIPKAHAA